MKISRRMGTRMTHPLVEPSRNHIIFTLATPFYLDMYLLQYTISKKSRTFFLEINLRYNEQVGKQRTFTIQPHFQPKKELNQDMDMTQKVRQSFTASFVFSLMNLQQRCHKEPLSVSKRTTFNYQLELAAAAAFISAEAEVVVAQQDASSSTLYNSSRHRPHQRSWLKAKAVPGPIWT